MLLNNTLLFRVYNKLLIVLFAKVVDTLATTEGTIPHGDELSFIFSLKVKKNQAIRRIVLLLVLLNQIMPSEYNELRLNKATTPPQHRIEDVCRRNKRYM